MTRRYFDPNPQDLDRCVRAWFRRGQCDQPCRSRSRAFMDVNRGLCVELRNIHGTLATFSVTSKRVTFFEAKG